MKKAFLSFLLIVFTSFSLISCGGETPLPNPDPVPDGYKYIDIVSINDLHGKILNDNTTKDPGLAKISRYINYRRARNPEGTVLISSGDMWQGSYDSNRTEGGLLTTWMNNMKFDSMTLGNHEFDWGEDVIRQNLQDSNFPYLGANIYKYADGVTIDELVDYAIPSTTFQRNGLKVGVIGFIGTSQWSSIVSTVADNFAFASPLSIIQKEATSLREDGCDVVILSMHEGASSSLKSLYGDYVDAIFCGHAHKTYIEKSSTPVIETGVDGHSLGVVRLVYNESTKELNVDQDETYFLADDVLFNYPQDSDTLTWVNENTNATKNMEVIGTLSGGDLEYNSKLGRLSANSILSYVESTTDYEIDYAIDSLEARASLTAGSITYDNLYKALPFDNEIVILSLNGAQLKNFIKPNSFYRKVVEAIVNDQVYTVAATDYIAFHKSSSRSYDYIKPSFDPETQLIKTMDGLYAREIVYDAFKTKGVIVASDYSGDHYSVWND